MIDNFCVFAWVIRSGKEQEGLAKLDAVRAKCIYAAQPWSTLEGMTQDKAMELY